MRHKHLATAIEEARIGLNEGGIPIGSVLVHEGRIIGRGHNRRVQQGSAILHAEMDALACSVTDRVTQKLGKKAASPKSIPSAARQAPNLKKNQSVAELAGRCATNAGRQPAKVYRAATIYTTLSPCAMCTGAILLYGIRHVVIGENKTFLGEEDLLRSRGVEVEVVESDECIELMQSFIAANPALWNEDIGK